MQETILELNNVERLQEPRLVDIDQSVHVFDRSSSPAS